MKILCLFITYPSNPDNHTMHKDLTKKMRENGKIVYVVTLQERKYGMPTSLEVEEGVNVLRVKSFNFFNTNIFEKGVTTILIGLLYMNAIRKYFKNHCLNLISSACLFN